MGMSNIPHAWGGDSPEPLIYTCARNVIFNPNIIGEKPESSNGWHLKPDITLPRELCETLLDAWQDVGAQSLKDDFLTIFEDNTRTRLKRANLSNSSITDEGLKIILSHEINVLDIMKCKGLTEKSHHYINLYGQNLTSLVLCKNIFKHYWEQEDSNNIVLETPKLLKLVLHDFHVNKVNFFSSLLRSSKNIVYLDLSGCCYLGDLDYIKCMKQLKTLILFNVTDVQKTIRSICHLKQLRVLDISQEKLKHGMFKSPHNVLRLIIKSLPNLCSLDISGTNLAGSGNFSPRSDSEIPMDVDEDDGELCDIPGLQLRIKKPLDFLGLYNTHNNACHRYSIPALVVTGEANEKQIIAAAEAYLDRPIILSSVLNELYRVFRFETFSDHKKALNLILLAMMKHKTEKHIQIAGSASLFYIAKEEEKIDLSFFAKNKIMTVLLDAMENFFLDKIMMRNGCLTISQFRIPSDIESGASYQRLVTMLLKFVTVSMEDGDFVKKMAMYLINSLACQVDGPKKKLVGDLGAIETMLSIIKQRLERNLHDDVLEIAWSTMWNVTDETPVNCQRFLDEHGMTYFQQCLESFPLKEELLRNMMGLLGNVAEVCELRPRLLRADYIQTFSQLLHSESDGIEVSYNAAGVLSHIASDGAEAWTLSTPSRDIVLGQMVEAISRWNIESRRNINYRSFEPILRLLRVKDTPECQLWAVWALANLTTVQPCKYCPLVEEEGGLDLVNNLASSTSDPFMLKLIKIIQDNCANN